MVSELLDRKSIHTSLGYGQRIRWLIKPGRLPSVWLLWAICAGTLILVAAAMVYVDRVNYHAYLQESRSDVARDMGVIRAELEGNISINIQTVRGLAAAIATEPDMTQKRFSELAEVIMQDRPQLKNVGAAPDMVISMIHPLAGNEAAVGLDYRTNAEQWPAVKRAARAGQMTLAGPISLVQGGQAFIGRIPVFIRNSGPGEPKLWGMISTVIDIDSLYHASGLANRSHLALALKKTPEGPHGPTSAFFGDNSLFLSDAVVTTIAIPGGTWLMAGRPLAGWPASADNAQWVRAVLGTAWSLIAVALLWLTHSIQRLHATQTRLRGLFELSPLGIALTDYETGAFVEINDALLAPTGYERHEIQQLTFWDITPREYVEKEAEARRAINCTGRYGPYEKEYIRRDGSRYPVLLNGMLTKDPSGKLFLWSIVEDITERKRMEQMKNGFVSTVSHELRTPLTSITGALSLIQGGALGTVPTKLQKVIDIAHRNGLQLKYLIDDLLDMEKLMSGNMCFTMEPVTLGPFVAEAVQANLAYAKQFQVSLNGQIKSADLIVKADPKRLHQIMANLISNAAKFSPEGETVDILLEQLNDQARISVIDRGPGISAEFSKHIFQKFSQADSSDTRAKGGTGLGLAISRELANSMGGAIDYSSTPGAGAVFFIELPLLHS